MNASEHMLMWRNRRRLRPYSFPMTFMSFTLMHANKTHDQKFWKYCAHIETFLPEYAN